MTIRKFKTRPVTHEPISIFLTRPASHEAIRRIEHRAEYGVELIHLYAALAREKRKCVRRALKRAISEEEEHK